MFDWPARMNTFTGLGGSAARAVLRAVLDEYDALGLTPVCGPELEFYFAHRVDGQWQRILNKTGRVYMTGSLVDPDGHYLHLLRMLDQLNVGAFAGNHEFCPSQYEINLWHSDALDAADRTFLLTVSADEAARRLNLSARIQVAKDATRQSR